MPHNRPKRKAIQKAKMAKETKPKRKGYVGVIAHKLRGDMDALIGLVLAMGLGKDMKGGE